MARGPKPALYECRGEHRTARAWAELAGLPVSILRQRLRAGWPLEEAIFTPLAAATPSKFSRSRKCAGCKYAKNFASSRDGSELYCDYLLMRRRKRPVPLEDCAGWDKHGRWRGPGPDPEEEDKQETNSKGG